MNNESCRVIFFKTSNIEVLTNREFGYNHFGPHDLEHKCKKDFVGVLFGAHTTDPLPKMENDVRADANVVDDVPDNVPDANPDQISYQWHQVRSALSHDASLSTLTYYESTVTPTMQRMQNEEASEAPPMGPDEPTNASKRSPYKRKRVSTGKKSVKSADMSDGDFAETVLRPRGVQIIQDFVRVKFPRYFKHFNVEQAPREGKAAYYRNMGFSKIGIWIDGGTDMEERAAEEFATAIEWQSPERRWSNVAQKWILLEEEMRRNWPKIGKFMCERSDEELITPKPEEGWDTLPILAPDDNTKHFEFKVAPDALYWLSLQAFSPDWTFCAKATVFVRGKRSLLPYLSVEYKKNSEATSNNKGRNQMAASLALCQFNRYQLRKRMMDYEKRSWTIEDSNLIRHYGITMFAQDFDIWVAEPNVTEMGEWKGTDIWKLWQHDLTKKEGIHDFVNWTNEIHRWGLSVYCEAIREEIRILAKSKDLTLPE